MPEEISLDEYRQLLKRQAKRKNKYNARATDIPGWGRADSIAEATRLGELILLERAGRITELMFHPKYELLSARPGWPAISYEADFQYWEAGRLIAEDVKGGNATQTEAWRIKARLFVERYPHIEYRIEVR
jgi:hypothetical protein